VRVKNLAGLHGFLTGFFRASVLALAILFVPASPVQAERAKDIATIQGMATRKLVGYGLVVGLDGTGDTRRSIVAIQTATNMLRRFGITIPDGYLRLKNIAAVMITAEVPAFMPEGSTLDALVSSMGDAKSLEGGTLLMSPLVDEQGTLFAHAQGPLSTGGFSIESIAGDRIRKNITLTGRVPGGATLVRSSTVTSLPDSSITLTLRTPDFTTAVNLATAINTLFNAEIAVAKNAVQINVSVPDDYKSKLAEFVSRVENVSVTTDVPARVVINERTGTVIVGANVTLSAVAIAHGNLRVEIQNTPIVSQPGPFSQGQTVVVPQTETKVTDSGGRVLAFEKSANVQDVARVLNALGVTPRDIVAIFQALKQAGALQAELVIM